MRRSLIWIIAVGSLGCSSASRETTGRASLPFAASGELSSKRSELVIADVPSGSPLIIGGTDGASSLASVESWDPVSGAFTAATGMGVGRKGHTATVLGTGDVVVLGGHATASGETWNGAAWTDVASGGAFFGHTASLLAGGTILVAGGNDGTAAVQPQLYDPAANTWSAGGTMKDLREQHAAVHLGDDRVVVFGGLTTPSTYLSSIEVYTPSTNSWAAGGDLSDARAQIATAVLSDGRVLLAGGTDGTSPKSAAELWNPTSDSAAAIASMSEARADARAVVLPTGRVLVMGGTGASGVLKSTEVFDPSTSKWSAGPSLAVPRRSFGVVVVSGGRVLIVGGHDGTSELKSTEAFGGVAPGGTCEIDEECAVGACKGGTCEGGVDAGPPVDPESPPTVAGNSYSGCTADSECPTGFCVEGVCCNTACKGKCESCSLPGSPGLCSLEPYGTDKKNACGASGGCVGTCDGKGECMAAGKGTQCLPVRCIGPAKGAGPAVCPAKGAACAESASVTFDCSPYACEAALGACRSTCGSSANCAPGFLCDANTRVCVAPAAGDDSDGCAYGTGKTSTSAFLVVLGMLGALTRRRRR